ncbi:MAG: hypothetical protein WC197_08755 [Candidatus Gastranaerophilaceae bacterium]|jgi:hypothetical protein
MSGNKNSFLAVLLIVLLIQFADQSPVMAIGGFFHAPKSTQKSSIPVNSSIETTKADDLESIKADINEKDKQKLKVNEPVKEIKGSFLNVDQGDMKNAFEIQKKKDIEDIKALWEATVERNSVIKFAVKKLATPPEQRKVHSSIMAKSVSTLISGASLLPGIFGANSLLSTASAASGTLSSRIINMKNLPKGMPLTDTELIQLAGLVEQLQNDIIKNYYDYKSSIEDLKECRSKLMLYNKNYSKALKEKNESNIIVTSAMYDNQVIEEIKLKQKIKLNRLELERLAGNDIVNKLNLTKLNTLAFKPEPVSSKAGGQ